MVLSTAAVAANAARVNGILIVAHRGALHEAPENTIAAFDAAARLGADYMEVDVRRTLDGHLVLMHDSTVDRTTNGKGAVAQLTLAEIRKLDAGKGERVPLFREALEWAKSKQLRIDVDHKAGGVEEIAAAIRDSGMTDRVVIEGGLASLREFSALLPGADTMPKVSAAREIPDVCRTLRTTVVRLSLAQLANPEMVRTVQAQGARVSVTILGKATDTEERMHLVVRQGARLIETDYPGVLAKVRERG